MKLIKQNIRKTQYFFRDIGNRIKFGRKNMPFCFETIWVDPQQVQVINLAFKRRRSGYVVDGDWDITNVKSIDENFKINACKAFMKI